MKRDIIERPHPRTDWAQVQVIEVAHERNLKYEGLSIADIAAAEGKEPLDAFIDIALDEDLETEFAHPAGSKSPEAMARVISRPDVSHLGFRRRGPHPVLARQRLARLLPGSLGPRRAAYDTGAGAPTR